MKIGSIIIDQEPTTSSYLKKCLLGKFPEIAIQGEASNYFQACKLIKTVSPNLVFVDMNLFNKIPASILNENGVNHFEMIYISSRPEDAISAIQQDACGFILKPLNVSDIIVSVESALRKLTNRSPHLTITGSFSENNAFLPHTKLIGIPTIEGIDFLYAHEIIRCEGLQKCTRFVSSRKNNMVSAYCIGEFKKLLEEHGFFSCHKSHLINLMHVKKFTREGFIFLSDNAAVPLARRKRLEFLQQIKHL